MPQYLDIETRMRRYEDVNRNYLMRRTPVIVRLDGRSFHGVTAKLFGKRNYSQRFVDIMQQVAIYATEQAQGCSFSYAQSDEISLLLTDYAELNSQAWFDYNINKINTILASAAASKFTQLTGHLVQFDSRCFNIPKEEVANYFYSRQLDCVRNAIQMAGHENFSHSDLQNKSCNQIQEMLFSYRSINFNDYPTARKRGYCVVNGVLDTEIPQFNKNWPYINRFVNL